MRAGAVHGRVGQGLQGRVVTGRTIQGVTGTPSTTAALTGKTLGLRPMLKGTKRPSLVSTTSRCDRQILRVRPEVVREVSVSVRPTGPATSGGLRKDGGLIHAPISLLHGLSPAR